ncbi:MULTISPECIES: cysteine desulfurase family protein [Romboutsia]|nr:MULTISPECIES: cysteine desulfurase family protein [Romboutsia]MCH1961247.1 cysteine desulfurase [Romboutsia hominis]MCH1968325.1 cysteine desulfurase [Romboutsia hominis]MDB8789571.1 cysteine desulfurase family protein [Romboutsia sp. 1001216sp1]MDB8793823.1 cysteine desulfurase family protein [Romboutsia sp. 1001216sp1]MDB8796718.1 cysteine desulfurase family protein [Romboutsia sp. 1001216sp1]
MEIYLDNSATTKPYSEVIEKVVYALSHDYANPSSLHRKGVEVEKNIKAIRSEIAKTLGAKDKEIYFTSGGTESNNTIIRGVVNLHKKRKNHIISTSIEHPSVLNTLKDLENDGCEVTYLDVDREGKIDLEELKKAIKPTTCLVTIMHVNNEVGSIQPIQEIGKYLKSLKDKVYLHVDAVQSYSKINFRPSRYNIDFMSVSGHKFHGPKGIGFMYIKETNRIKPMLTGGGQEIGVRAGTENAPGIYGLGEAIKIINDDLNSKIEKISSLKNLLKEEISKNIEDIKINSPEDGVCHILNISFKDIKGEVLLHCLEQKGMYVSTGSACSSKKKGSHVLTQMKLTNEEIEGAIRFSLSDLNTEEEILEAVKILKEEVESLRKIIRRS